MSKSGKQKDARLVQKLGGVKKKSTPKENDLGRCIKFKYDLFKENQWKVQQGWKERIQPKLDRIEQKTLSEIHGDHNYSHVKLEFLPQGFQMAIKRICGGDLKRIYYYNLGGKERLWFHKQDNAVFQVIRYNPNHKD